MIFSCPMLKFTVSCNVIEQIFVLLNSTKHLGKTSMSLTGITDDSP